MFKKFKALVENQTGGKIEKLRTNNGLEFCESDFNKFCTTQGIAKHKTLVRKPLQNGVAEHINQTLLERARYMLFNANLWHCRDFWAEATSIACYLVNHSLHLFIDFKIAEEV